MKTIVVYVLIAALAIPFIPRAALAESVFDCARTGPPRLRLERSQDTRGLDAVLASSSGDSGAPGAVATGVSPLRAGASSLCLPGLGEQRLGATMRAKVFFGLEAVGWITVASFLWAGHSRANAYKEYAVVFAGITGTDHSDDYYKTIGEYLASDGPGGYNESVRREARDLYYPNVEAMDAYYHAHAITGDKGWSWRDESTYGRYGSLRDGSRFDNRVALYSAFGLAALRIVSAADAVRLARIDGRSAAAEGRTSIGFEPAPRGMALYVQRSF
ncbi:MAG TPA: hypothetical protein VII85_02175 [Candidatus Krumholzibacteriaceae bacterium]